MSQSGRLSAWETEAGASGLNYEEAFHANCDSLGIAASNSTNGRMVLYLQDILSSTVTSLPSLQALCAVQLSKTRWDEVGSDIATLHYTLGTNIVANGDFSVAGSWTTGSPWIVDNAGSQRAITFGAITGASILSQGLTTINATEYRVELEVVGDSGSGVSVDLGGVDVIAPTTGTGIFSGFITVAGISNTLEILAEAGFTAGQIDNVKVQQVTR